MLVQSQNRPIKESIMTKSRTKLSSVLKVMHLKKRTLKDQDIIGSTSSKVQNLNARSSVQHGIGHVHSVRYTLVL